MLCYFLLFHIKSIYNPYFSFTFNSITCTFNKVTYPNGKCVLKSCKYCPKYKIPTVEWDETIHSPIIKFHMYEVFTIYSKHGTIGHVKFICHVYSNFYSVSVVKKTTKLSRRKTLTLKNLSIGQFTKEYYIPVL